MSQVVPDDPSLTHFKVAAQSARTAGKLPLAVDFSAGRPGAGWRRAAAAAVSPLQHECRARGSLPGRKLPVTVARGRPASGVGPSDSVEFQWSRSRVTVGAARVAA